MFQILRDITVGLLVMLCLPLALRAAACEDLAWHALESASVIAASREASSERYPNADVVDVDSHKWVRYAPDGTYEEYYESYSKVLTEKGRRTMQTVSSTFVIPYNTTAFELAEVIRPDGEVLAIDIPRNTRVMIEHEQMGENIFNPNSRVLQLTVPNLEPGDLLHFIMHDVFTRSRTPGNFSDYVVFEGTNPIMRSSYTLIGPESLPIRRVALKSEQPGTVTSLSAACGGLTLRQWVARDVPRAFEEPDMPPLYTQVQRLLVSTMAQWPEVSRWYWSLCEPHIKATTPEMRRLTDELTDGLSPEDKVRALFQWVSREVRYLGLTLEETAPGYEPHPASLTFEQRAGVCRDKAALLVAMLRQAGLEAYPVLIMNGPRKDPEVPQPFFNHAVSAVRTSEGTYLLMDATDENTRELFPAYLNNQSFLVATPEGEELLTSPIEPAGQNLVRISTTGTLESAHTLRAHSLITFSGINDNAYRSYFARVSKDERRSFFERIVQRVAPGAEIEHIELSPENMLDTSQPLTARLVFTVHEPLIRGEGTTLLPVPSMGTQVGMVNFLAGEIGLTQRRFPLMTRYACGVQESVDLDLEGYAGSEAVLPTFRRIDTTGTTWERDMSYADGRLKCHTRFELKLPEYDPGQYRDLQQALQTIEADNRKMPVFTDHPEDLASPPGYRADALVLGEHIDYDLHDPQSWTETHQVRIKVLSYAGKKRYSELIVPFNPAWERLELTRASVVTPEGEEKTISADEINIMDAPWAGTAPRYPAGKVLVASFPGLSEGGTIDYTLTRSTWKRPFFALNGHFLAEDMRRRTRDFEHTLLACSEGVLRYQDPLLSKVITLRVPRGMDLTLSCSEEPPLASERTPIAYTRREEGEFIVHTYRVQGVPPVRLEPSLPPWHTFTPMLFASEGSWLRYAKAVNAALTSAAADQGQAAERARTLTLGIRDERERLRIIRDYVAKAIRPVEIDFSALPLACLTPADVTLAEGYAREADRAVLLYAMLKAAGFRPQFVLASWLPTLERLQRPLLDFPNPAYFDRVLVRVKTARGAIYLNDTDQYAALGSTPSHGRPGLDLRTGRIRTIRINEEKLTDRVDKDLTITLDGRGNAELTWSNTYYGMERAAFCRQTLEMPPEERRRHLLELASSISKSARPEGAYETDCLSYPSREAFTLNIPDLAILTGDFVHLELPGLTTGIQGVQTDRRDNPLYRHTPSRQRTQITLTLPADCRTLKITPPPAMDIPLEDAGDIRLETRCEDGRVSLTQEVRLDEMVVTPEDYPALLEAQRKIAHPGSRTLLLKLQAPESGGQK